MKELSELTLTYPQNHEWLGEHVSIPFRWAFERSPIKTVVDIGAFVGSLSCLAAANGCKVLAVEPNLIALEILRKNVLANHLQVEDCSRAIWCHSDSIKDVQGTSPFFGATGLVQPEWQKTFCQTLTLSLDDLLMDWPSVDYLKMDVEGAEHVILPAFHDWQKIHWFALEIHPVENRPNFHASWAKNMDLEGLLQKNGFVRAGDLYLWERT